MKKQLTTILLAALSLLPATARERQNFDGGWLFCLNDKDSTLWQDNTSDASWRRLSLPHDWAIEGDFSASNPSGAGGGALPGGIGWYRKHFRLVPQQDEKVFIDFDGVYMNAMVWINGHRLGTRPYGYSPFRYELTPWLHADGDNILTVKVDDSDQPNSRWYSGCGIYRHVWLTTTNALYIEHWGISLTPTLGLTPTPPRKGRGLINASCIYVDANHSGTHPAVRYTVYDPQGRQVAQSESGTPEQTLTVKNPLLWSPATPNVYTVKTELIDDGKTVDAVTTTTGFRSFHFDAKTGFWLNGKNMKINGVCMHHDLGCLGAALNEDALHRQLVKLKAMGVNAIRCSHNPPAPELLNMCDTMGFIVMDESFDMWRKKKTENDYARYFDWWHERDLSDLVLRDRNHPSILIWSIGNEVLEQWSSANADNLSLEEANLILNAGHKIDAKALKGQSWEEALARQLAAIIHRYDTTRPITAGCNEPDPNNHLFRSGALDLIGFNYHNSFVKDVPKNFPGKPFLFTESVSALQTRGYYRQPSDSLFIQPDRWDKPFTDPTMMCSAYDNSCVPWGNTHEETWDLVKHTPYVSGQFIWTGFDYIGEPTPFGFPARSSYFGIIDLAGFPKDSYYMYQSEWTDKPVLHLFPHWNWNPGQTVDLWCYYNHADEVELFVNGKSQGVRRKKGTLPSTDMVQHDPQSPVKGLHEDYHVAWRVKYDPGEVKVVARKKGKEVASETIRTAGAPYTIKLTEDYRGKNTLFVEADVVDKDGTLCPWADDDLTFDVTGGKIIGVDNGCPFSMERFQADHRKAFMGKALVVIRPDDNTRSVTLKAVSPTLQATDLSF